MAVAANTRRKGQGDPAGPGAKILLALDYGRARIGVARADSEAGVPRTLATIRRINRNEDMRRLREIARAHDVAQIVVGLPLRLDGTRGQMAEEVEKFAERLRKQLGLPVELVDERLTSWEAGQILKENKAGTKDRAKGRAVDEMAAALILREYLDRRQSAKGQR